MSRLNTLLSKGEKNICSVLVEDSSSKGRGIFESLNTAIPCNKCDTCGLNTPYAEILEMLDE